jgi:hypothetical protein
MADVFSRRNALLGWLAWKVVKRRLRVPVGAAAGASRRARSTRLVAAIATLAVLVAAGVRRVLRRRRPAE